MNILIRNELVEDYRKVEELTREAFWNLYVPGCDEHYLVHIMRDHPDFISDLDFVAIYKEGIIGNIMYTRSFVVDKNDSNHKIDTVTFGPVSVLPEYQRKGVGSSLIKHSMNIAFEKGYKAVIILGHPHNYCKHGFKSSKDFNISDTQGKYPYGMLVFEIEKGIFQEGDWVYHTSEVYNVDQSACETYDRKFKSKKKEYRYSQEEFSIACRAFIM